MFRNILVPTDGSAMSRRAIRLAVGLAKQQGARVTGFHVGPRWEPRISGDSVGPDFVSPQQHAENVKKTAQRYLRAVERAAAAAGVACRCVHAMGAFPYEHIVKAARDNRCDLIVMASHGRRGISRLLLGSETAKVLAHSTIPVLVVR